MGNLVIGNPARRRFLLAMPAAAAAGFTLADATLFPGSSEAQDTGGAEARIFTAQTIQDDMKALNASPGDNKLVEQKTFTVVLTTEKAKSAREFEWHEGRDHILQILDGSTVVEVGGTPQNGRNTKPGEWLAPGSEGAVVYTLQKGDMLVIPRGTPHRRRTAASVTLTLMSPQGTAS
jgi:mannose-6-phosphate isomerase-like protein (cupin superfamily)